MNINISNQNNSIQHTSFRDLVSANAIKRVEVHFDGRYWVLLHVGNVQRVLSAKRGHVRRFSSLDSVVKYFRTVGVQRFEVELL